MRPGNCKHQKPRCTSTWRKKLPGLQKWFSWGDLRKKKREHPAENNREERVQVLSAGRKTSRCGQDSPGGRMVGQWGGSRPKKKREGTLREIFHAVGLILGKRTAVTRSRRRGPEEAETRGPSRAQDAKDQEKKKPRGGSPRRRKRRGCGRKKKTDEGRQSRPT